MLIYMSLPPLGFSMVNGTAVFQGTRLDGSKQRTFRTLDVFTDLNQIRVCIWTHAPCRVFGRHRARSTNGHTLNFTLMSWAM